MWVHGSIIQCVPSRYSLSISHRAVAAVANDLILIETEARASFCCCCWQKEHKVKLPYTEQQCCSHRSAIEE